MSEDLKMIAARIQELRQVFDLSEEDVAKDLGISAELYRSYENEGENIPISVLYHLASKYNVDLTEILTGRSPRLDTFAVVPKGHGIQVDRYPGYKFQSLAYKFMHKIMEPLLVTVEPSEDEPALVAHAGQEFNLVLKGSIYFLYDDKKLLLKAGDSVYFNPTHPHGQMAACGKEALFLTVITEEEPIRPSEGR
ncbi:cupin domain-containing protein [Oscillospiraceae bacterium OttesenSCG-928-F05]|nr:cupin domain-containing protein [Oscillospiraceae bacterium OttesenSCG-928-F05]